MDYGALNSYFEGAVAKMLAPVDIDTGRSNQHEFNGTSPLRWLFGDDDIKNMSTTFVYMQDDGDPVFDHGLTTWYDARRRHPTRTEYRLYYKDNAAVAKAHAGDLMVIAITESHEVLVIVAKASTTVESQVRWLFGLGETKGEGFVTSDVDGVRIGLVAARILESVGIEVGIPLTAETYLDGLIDRFGARFPRGIDFTAYARETLGELDWKHEPDACLLACYEREEMLFRVFERHMLERDLAPFMAGGIDVDGVLRVTMSAFQRRKSRAGTAFENQLAAMFDARGIRYSAQAYTEGKSKPDFIFPSIAAYRDSTYPDARLTMLGAKTTIKERWRQVLEEADRVRDKHLITLEPAVSEAYTDAMRKSRLTLVVPRPLFATFTVSQQNWLLDVESFCILVEERQGL